MIVPAAIASPAGRSLTTRGIERTIMLSKINGFVVRLAKDERGLTSVEYAVLGGIVVAALVGIGAAFNTNLTAAFNNLFELI